MPRTLSQETKDKIRQKALGHKRNLGRKLSAATIEKIRQSMKSKKPAEEVLRRLRALGDARRGISLSPDRIAKLRQVKSQMMVCPYCAKVGKAGGMQKHHFEHCKQRGSSISVEQSEMANAT
jgi:hypothetical protein